MRALVAITAVMLAGCGNGGSPCTAGSEGCECTPAGNCDSPNTCVSGICMPPAADTGVDGDAPSDTAADTAADDAVGEIECATDTDCDDSDPCTVDSCDMDYNECVHVALDADHDGYPAMAAGGTACAGGTDCLDDLATAFPGAPAVPCSLLDNDCNGNEDEDQDGDGHADYACAGGDDCDDSDGAVLLGECTGVNECCDGCWQRNGCWTDTVSGLVWEDPPSDGAVSYCTALSLPGHGPGEWRLPTISELRTLIRGCPATEDGGACGVTDSCLDDPCLIDCGGCSGGGPGVGGCFWDPALEGTCDCYWSSSSHAAYPSYAWFVYVYGAVVGLYDKGDYHYVRCVRPGP